MSLAGPPPPIARDCVNLNRFLPHPLLFDPRTLEPLAPGDLSAMMPPSLAGMELSRAPRIELPGPVALALSEFRPTPLRRAARFEAALGTRAEIYVKDEGESPTGNHKASSAFLVAYLCARDGIETITTETTGNWGIALAAAARRFGIKAVCFLDSRSHESRPDRKRAMEACGARVTIVPVPRRGKGALLLLTADEALRATAGMRKAAYVFGSVFNYFIAPQTIAGIEAKAGLDASGRAPDVIVGSCGGGANLLGTAAPFLVDRVRGLSRVEVVAAEAVGCPILSRGRFGLRTVDTIGRFPALRTYGIPGVSGSDYLGGLGSTIVAAAAAHFHSEGLIRAERVSAPEARAAARLFRATEGRWVALESAHAIAAAARIASAAERAKVILVGVSAGGGDRRLLARAGR